MSNPNTPVQIADPFGVYNKNDYKTMLNLPDVDRRARRRRLHAFLWRCIPGVTERLTRPSEENIEACWDKLLKDLPMDSKVGAQILEDWNDAIGEHGFPWKEGIDTANGQEWQKLFFQAVVFIFVDDYHYIKDLEKAQYLDLKAPGEIITHYISDVADGFFGSPTLVLRSAMEHYRSLG